MRMDGIRHPHPSVVEKNDKVTLHSYLIVVPIFRYPRAIPSRKKEFKREKKRSLVSPELVLYA